MSHKLKKVLVTNDDGINGRGLQVLVESLKKVAEVYVLAPDSNRSAVSSKITMGKGLSIQKFGEGLYACSGMPADCVITAFKSPLFGVQFDAVVSGINSGPNMGTDVVYSGTCAAARQAVLMGVPGIAVSLESKYLDYEIGDEGFNFKPLADFTANNLDELISLCDGEVFVSLNATSADSYKEAAFASGCIRDYGDKVSIKSEGEDLFSGHCTSDGLSVTGEADSDYNIARSGKIAVSLIYAEPVLKRAGQSVKFKF
ncbi:5'/3'-nucleotidase SurE [Treponema ruminis]|uniref:5'-nucleotidase n=1 Tax=Treponema ruminis TaxID=744515 RepID=A0A7W8G7K1_9SPIR|nr:5'/3'-nucleotidase SurE [Treponema ruminis]MBB5225338.1 5'-nucleotidase [Treponema ruminis]QSI01791.1 5'/3'-nucleotidase SurE [Treponema ruminis]